MPLKQRQWYGVIFVCCKPRTSRVASGCVQVSLAGALVGSVEDAKSQAVKAVENDAPVPLDARGKPIQPTHRVERCVAICIISFCSN
jgi:hypothetical protein